jgi:hypothetical protein
MGKHGSSVGDVVVEPVVAVCDVDNPVVGAFVVGGKCGKGSSSLPGLPDSPRAEFTSAMDTLSVRDTNTHKLSSCIIAATILSP